MLRFENEDAAWIIDNNPAYLNSTATELDTAPAIINDRTMLPIRFIAESFGFDVGWDGPSKTITISNKETTDTTAVTEAGLVKGNYNNGIYEYLGVPYAEAKEMFVKADKVTPW